MSLLGPPDVQRHTREELKLHMRGRAVFNFVLSHIPASQRACLERAGMSLDQIDLFALHQGSIYMLDALVRRVGIPDAKVLKNMNRYGNTVSSTIPLLLAELQDRDELRGRTVMLSGFGVGLSWSTAIVRFAP